MPDLAEVELTKQISRFPSVQQGPPPCRHPPHLGATIHNKTTCDIVPTWAHQITIKWHVDVLPTWAQQLTIKWHILCMRSWIHVVISMTWTMYAFMNTCCYIHDMNYACIHEYMLVISMTWTMHAFMNICLSYPWHATRLHTSNPRKEEEAWKSIF